MEYLKLCKVYQELESTTKRLEKTDILAKLLKSALAEDLQQLVYLVQGRVFPLWDEREIGMSSRLVLKAIANATGIDQENVEKFWKKVGDLGKVAENLIGKKKQVTLVAKKLTVKKVFENLRKLAELTGVGTVARKLDLVVELLTAAKPVEARFIVRTILAELRIGVAKGVVRDSVAKAYNVDVGKVEKAFGLSVDYSEVAKLAKKGEKALLDVKPSLGRPLQSMEAIKKPDLKTAMEDAGKPCGIEKKFDGYKLQVHKDKENILLFTRRQENVTNAFPDLIEAVKKSFKVKSCIVEGECIALTKNFKPRPFQFISKRIRRKYDLKKTIKEIPVELKAFDILIIGNKNLIKEPLRERRKELKKIIKEIPHKISISEQLVTDNLEKADKFYKKALKEGYEGVMIKNLKAKYQPGRRVGYQYKVKPTLEPLDLVIVGATYGTGKRGGILSSFILACKSGNKFLECGMMGTGIKEKKGAGGVTFSELTKLIKPLVIAEKGRIVKVKPEIVVEVGYEEIQKSPNYAAGYALRFPRLLRLRIEDKRAEQTNTLTDVKRIFDQQKGKGSAQKKK